MKNMPKVTFLPSGTRLDVAPGTGVIDAARRARVLIDLPCGGKGTCGKCLVRVTEGSVESKPGPGIDGKEAPEGFVNACLSSIVSDVIITVSDSAMAAGDSLLDDGIDTTTDRLSDVAGLSPLSRSIQLAVAKPEPEDGLSDLDRVNRGLAAAMNAGEVRWPLSVIRKLADALREQDSNITLTIASENEKNDPGDDSTHCHSVPAFAGIDSSGNPGIAKSPGSPPSRGRQQGRACPVYIIDVRSGHDVGQNLGIAVDLGTTTISVQLVDLADGRVLSTRNGYNEQIRCGLDVISRINYASTGERLEDIRSRAVHSINRLILEAVESSHVRKEDITCCSVSGNTVMTHLLLGLKPEYIRLDPYTPTVMEPPSFSAHELGVDIHPNALVSLSPCVGSYVGGDITSGVLVTGLAKGTEDVSLFIDIGTNGEIVLGNRDFLMTCACSAGPAFEGGGIDCGMRATTGAIDHVTIDRDTGRADCTVIGAGKPCGICGSGLIDLVAGLFITGWIDSSGKLERTRTSPFIRMNGRRASYLVAGEEDSKAGKPIVLTETDIENLMRAKAAIYSAASLLLRQTDLSFGDLARFYVAGGFGRFLNLENAVSIGLLPDIPAERFCYVGNASLSGTRLCLLSGESRKNRAELSARMTYIDLSSFPGYMDQYTAALFFPHTELHHFPTVIGKMGR